MQSKSAASKSHEIKKPAIAFGVYDDGAKRLGEVAVTDKGLVWSKSKNAKDVTVKWDTFIEWMQSQLQAEAKTVKTVKAASAKADKTAKALDTKTPAKSSKAAPAKKAVSKANGKAVTAKKAPAKTAKPKAASKTAH